MNNSQRQEMPGTVAFERPAPGVVKLTVKGSDPTSLTGQVLDRVGEDIRKHGKVDCFIDIRWASSLPAETGSTWLTWVKVNRQSVNQVHILASSRMVAMFMNMGIGMAGVSDFVQVHGDSQQYQRQLDACVQRRAW